MTDTTLSADMQAAQDMLAALSNQRNAAQNESVQLAAQLQAAQRKIVALEAKVKELSSAQPTGNGHDADVAHPA